MPRTAPLMNETSLVSGQKSEHGRVGKFAHAGVGGIVKEVV